MSVDRQPDPVTLTDRGTRTCRACGAGALTSVLDLGRQPLANEMGTHPGQQLPTFPLHLRMCGGCGLGQVGEYVTPERIFAQDYPYLSSTSASWVRHAADFAALVHRELQLVPDDTVVEVASNDGYLLSELQSLGIRVLGVEPAHNVARIAVDRGIPTMNEFFGVVAAQQVRGAVGVPRLIVANNVMAHVPDLHDFIGGMATLAGDETVITVENPSLLNLLIHRQFDTIYHEHFSYLTATAVKAAVEAHGLELVRVDQLPTHGGSNRYWLAPAGRRARDPSVVRVLSDEHARGLLDPAVWGSFARASWAAVDGLRAWLDRRRARGAVVAGYGAAAKGNTLLNAAGTTTVDLAYVVDGGSAKQGLFLPGSRVPVLHPDQLADADPDDVLVLPWNIATELRPLIARSTPRAQVWVAIPRMTNLS